MDVPSVSPWFHADAVPSQPGGVILPFGQLYDCLKEEICILNDEGDIVFCNAAWKATPLLNSSAEEGVVGANYLAITSAAQDSQRYELVNSSKRILAAIRSVLSRKQDLAEIE